MTAHEQLLADIAAFCKANDMAETTFGQRAVHEWRVVDRLREGRVTLRTVDRVRAYLDENTKPLNGKRRRRAA